VLGGGAGAIIGLVSGGVVSGVVGGTAAVKSGYTTANEENL
jgi:hypothetical protein